MLRRVRAFWFCLPACGCWNERPWTGAARIGRGVSQRYEENQMNERDRILMCPPDFYTVDYVINPWMDGMEGQPVA